MHREPDLEPESPEPSGNIVIPIWVIWIIVGLFIPATAYFMSTLHDIRDDIKHALTDRWTKSDARESFYELRDKNPAAGLKTPDVDEISNRLEGRP